MTGNAIREALERPVPPAILAQADMYLHAVESLSSRGNNASARIAARMMHRRWDEWYRKPAVADVPAIPAALIQRRLNRFAAHPAEEPGEVERLTRERDSWRKSFETMNEKAVSNARERNAQTHRAETAEAALADQASQEERIREDERDRLYAEAEALAADPMTDAFDEDMASFVRDFLKVRHAMLPADRARLRGGAS